MNHRKAGRTLGRKSDHRQAMYRNMSISLLKHGAIKTTVHKAKELRRFVEPLITRSATDTLANKRLIFSRLRCKATTHMLFSVIGPHFEKRPGGYLRIVKAGYRAGDAAIMAYVQLMDYIPQEDKPAQKSKAKVNASTKPSQAALPEDSRKKVEKTAEAKPAAPVADDKQAEGRVSEAVSKAKAKPMAKSSAKASKATTADKKPAAKVAASVKSTAKEKPAAASKKAVPAKAARAEASKKD
jgi:large subunit ribosomal protein L17